MARGPVRLPDRRGHGVVTEPQEQGPGSGTGVRQDITIPACALPDPPAVDQLPTTGDNNNLIMWSLLFTALGALVVLRLRTIT